MEKKGIKKLNIILFVLGIFFIGGSLIIFLSFFSKIKKTKVEKVISKTVKVFTPDIALASNFASYEEVSVNVTPKVKYEIKEDLSNITNLKYFDNDEYDEESGGYIGYGKTLSNKTKNLISKNGFAVESSYESEFFELYENNRYDFMPNFITTDSILHNYHLIFDNFLKKIEEEKFVYILKKLNADMLSLSLNQYQSLKGTTWEKAVKTNISFFAVGNKLLDNNAIIPEIVKNEVNKEFLLIKNHQGINQSPIMGLDEDYSQYIPRGHYDKNNSLKAYFKAMMWYGRMTFLFNDEDKIKSTILITLLLNNKESQINWDKIYETIGFFVGKSDDVTYFQIKSLLKQIYGDNIILKNIVNDSAKFNSIAQSMKKLQPPQIYSVPTFAPQITPDKNQATKGFRYFPQRFTIDALIFQKLIYREVGNKKGVIPSVPDETTRMLPKALDIPAAMGSEEALNILQEYGETDYKNYTENLKEIKKYISGLDKNHWNQNLYWGWLYTLLPLTEKKPEGYPTFMRNTAWERKELNTYLSSWTELKHDTILYAKQVIAEMGDAGIIEKDDRGYVEPNVYIYSRLLSLTKMTKNGLKTRGLLNKKQEEILNIMEELVLNLKKISEKELNNIALTKTEYDFIRSYGGSLEHLWNEIYKKEIESSGSSWDIFLSENPAALISDVATDPNSGQVLEEGIGKIFNIYVVVPVDGKLRIASGGVYSYYEFTMPSSQRLTDKKWRRMLGSDNEPQLPDWTNMFIIKNSN